MDLTKILDVTPDPSSESTFLGMTPQPNPDDDYFLPTPMADFQKELTDDIVSLHYSDILKYFETNNKEDFLLTDSLQKLYLNIQLISSHPYLLIDHFMPKSLLAKDIPLKLVQTSGKFKILKNVLDVLTGVQEFKAILKQEIHERQRESLDNKRRKRELVKSSEKTIDKKVNQAIIASTKKRFLTSTVPNNKNILIISRGGRSLDLIESLLLGIKVPYLKHSGNYVKLSNKDRDPKSVITHPEFDLKKRITNYSVNLNTNLENYLSVLNFNLSPIFNVTVHLLASEDIEAGVENSENLRKVIALLEKSRTFVFDLVIPFDISVDTGLPMVSELRMKNHGRRVKKAPLIRLIPIYTVEHIAHNFNYKNGDGINENFRNTISAVVVERGKVGSIDPNLKSVYANNLEFLSSFLLYYTDTSRKNDILDPIFWPLPPISKIPMYKPQDVEKSLLTEVKYLPEDDYSDVEDEIDRKKANDKLEFEDFDKFRSIYIKKPSDYFYETKRLNNQYIVNPLHLKNRSNIIGIEAESVVGKEGYYDYLMKELILTHFEIFQLNLKYLKYGRIEGDLDISQRLNDEHLKDFEASLDELHRFLTDDNKIREKYQSLITKKEVIQKALSDNRLEELEERFKKLSDISETEAKDDSVSKWKANQLKIIELLEKKDAAKKTFELRENEASYLKEELNKIDKVFAENETDLVKKVKIAEEKQQELTSFVKKYDELQDVSSSKRRKMNEMISEVDGLMLSVKGIINVSEERSGRENRGRRRK